MRRLKRISFLIYSCLLLWAGFYGHIKYEETFYPGSRQPATERLQKETKEAAPAASAPSTVTHDTLLVIRSYRLSTGETKESEGKTAAKYIGMDREEFVRCMEDEMAAAPLAERKEGLVSIEVVSFSPQRIVVKKTYRKPDSAVSFYLALRENRVIVYEEDKSTVFMRTLIDARNLPEALRDEIARGMEIDGREELERFLADYSRIPNAE